ncbi:MAG: glycoside hydrolase family 9 protein [Acidobacteriaceae bacterium]|nr:glycoside hydrolase family 9 protein [Acidobacteriaceae bacterium]
MVSYKRVFRGISHGIALAGLTFFGFGSIVLAGADPSAYVRVSQVGYEAGNTPFRAYLMSTDVEPGATFRVVNSHGNAVYSAAAGPLLGTWSNSKSLTYQVYALDFNAPEGDTYTISVSGPVPTTSPRFAVGRPAVLYPGLLLNTRFFYESERDGPDYIRNALRTAPGHLNDEQAKVYLTPPLDDNDLIATSSAPLAATGAVIDGSGGWWDAGDYMKYVETTSYTVALQEIGIRDFPNQLGPGAPLNPPSPPASISYAGNAAGSPSSSDFTSEAQFGIEFLMKMWDDKSRTLYYQVGNSQDWVNYSFLSDYDIWRLPQADDDWDGCSSDATYICHRPAFVAGPAGSKISPNLAGRLAADFAVCYQLNREREPGLAHQCLQNAEDIFELGDTSLADPANSVGAGTCTSGCLLTIIPFDGYPETVWDDDMELGAAELYFALWSAQKRGDVPAGLPHSDPSYYLKQAAQFAQNYITRIYNTGNTDTLNLYDVSGLAHFELYQALALAGSPTGLAVTRAGIREQLLKQVGDAISQAKNDTWGFGDAWNADTTSHGGGLSVMASEAYYLTHVHEYEVYSQRWMANVLGANAWGSSFIVGDGSATFPNCIQHQVANLAGALDGTSNGTPVLWGAVSEGPARAATSGIVSGMILCPANGADAFKIFNGNSGAYNADNVAVYQDNMQSYSTTEPAIDLTATSFLMWAWRLAGAPVEWWEALRR